MLRLILLFALITSSLLRAEGASPNIVLILADDLGYGDLGCYGHPVAKTPVLDRLAADGVRFTQHYSNGPECSPTRTALLTGRYQQRVRGLECAIGTGNVGRYDEAIQLANERELGLAATDTVLPRALRDNNYLCGLFGKWHLGYEPQFNPMEHGWDSFFGYLGGNVHYFNHRETSPLHVLFQGRLPVYRDGYMTHLITDAAIEFLDRADDRPFFLYVAHECPHFPFQAPTDRAKEVTADNWMEFDQDAYVAMLEDLDREVGRLLQAVEKRGLADNTLFVFASDNGGFDGAAYMGGLRGSKGTTFEGGIRVPLIVRWPGKIQPGTMCEQPCLTFDLTRSFLRIAGVDVSPLQLDGMDIIEHVVQGKSNITRDLFWRGRRGDRTWTAVRHDDLKLVCKEEAGERQEWVFDLANDPEEQNSLPEHEARRDLQQRLDDWQKDVDTIRSR